MTPEECSSFQTFIFTLLPKVIPPQNRSVSKLKFRATQVALQYEVVIFPAYLSHVFSVYFNLKTIFRSNTRKRSLTRR